MIAVLDRAAELVTLDIEGKIRAGGQHLPLHVSHERRQAARLLAAALIKLSQGDVDLVELMCPNQLQRSTAETEPPPEGGEA